MPDLTLMLPHLRKRRGPIKPETTGVSCTYHGYQRLVPVTHDGICERFCAMCMTVSSGAAMPAKVHKPNRCERCKTDATKLAKCGWCDRECCMNCLRGDDCIECSEEAQYPPEARDRTMRGS